MNKFSSLVVLLFLIQVYCKYTTYDGSKLISLSYSPNLDYDATERVCVDNFSQEMISYYSWFASYGYCEDSEIPVFCCANHAEFFTGRWEIISESSTSKYFTYNYVLWRSDEYKKYILAFPGTRNDAKELLSEAVNIKMVKYNNDGVKVANYFYKVMLEIKEILFTNQVLQDINNHPGYQFIVTGHSLGGAVASVVLYDAVNSNYINPSLNEPVMITYGQPRTGNEKYVKDFNSKIPNYFRVVRDGDLVASIPVYTLFNPFKHQGGLILLNKEMTSMNYCPLDIGENYPDEECTKSLSLDTDHHVYYFNPEIHFSERCSPNK